jgi:hypothetical protein
MMISAWESLSILDSNKRSKMAQNECSVVTGLKGLSGEDKLLRSMA